LKREQGDQLAHLAVELARPAQDVDVRIAEQRIEDHRGVLLRREQEQ
jgi:hypothetical protein